MYIDKLDEIVNEYNNSCHKTIKMKPAEVKSSTYIDFNVENNDEDHKFEVGDFLRISQYKSIVKGFNRKEIVGTFYEK